MSFQGFRTIIEVTTECTCLRQICPINCWRFLYADLDSKVLSRPRSIPHSSCLFQRRPDTRLQNLNPFHQFWDSSGKRHIVLRKRTFWIVGYTRSSAVSEYLYYLWASLWENVPSDICARRRLKSACTSARSDRSFRCPHEESLHPWLSKMCPVEMRTRLRECAGWSESSLSAHVWRYVFWRCGWYISMQQTQTRGKSIGVWILRMLILSKRRFVLVENMFLRGLDIYGCFFVLFFFFVLFCFFRHVSQVRQCSWLPNCLPAQQSLLKRPQL